MASSRNNTLEFSSAGSVIIDENTAHPVNEVYGAIQFLKDSEIDEITATNIENDGLLTGTLNAGTILYGNFDSVSIASGLVALHRV